VLGSHLFQLIGFAVALPMMAIEFDRRVISQHRQLFNSRVAAGTDSARCRAHESIDAAYAHDLRSALFLLDGAARTLVDRLDDLSSSDRTEFGRLIGSGVERLSTLVCELAAEVNECELHNVVRSVVKAEKNSGLTCSFDLPKGIRCAARPADVAGILHTLIRTVWTESGPATVSLTGRHQGQRIALTIAPTGLGGQPADRRPGWLHPSVGQAPAKDAVELQIAARLLNEQGGAISTATDDHGLTSFEITLPAAQPALRLLEGVQ
jgi:nitrogen-specific signal transduction histidine kinase